MGIQSVVQKRIFAWDTCGRANPWLSSEEMADIINAALYRDERVTPVTTSCWGGNPYSHAELRERANGYSSVSSVSVIQGNGLTNEIVFQTNKGEKDLVGLILKLLLIFARQGDCKFLKADMPFLILKESDTI